MSDDQLYRNTERFIHEVSTRSCIWNTNCMEYKIRNKRKIAWEEICSIFFSNFNSKNDDTKEHLCRILQRKWKSIRDTYVRDLRKNKQKKYLHANSLNFLGQIIKLHKPLEAKAGTYEIADYKPDPYKEEQEEDDEEDEDEEREREEEMSLRNNSYFNSSDPYQSLNSNNYINLEVQTLAETKMTSPLSEQSKTKNKSTADQDYDNDEDRLFLLSLLKDLKKVPDYNKLEAKSELLLVLSKWKKSKAQIWCSDVM